MEPPHTPPRAASAATATTTTTTTTTTTKQRARAPLTRFPCLVQLHKELPGAVRYYAWAELGGYAFLTPEDAPTAADKGIVEPASVLKPLLDGSTEAFGELTDKRKDEAFTAIFARIMQQPRLTPVKSVANFRKVVDGWLKARLNVTCDAKERHNVEKFFPMAVKYSFEGGDAGASKPPSVRTCIKHLRENLGPHVPEIATSSSSEVLGDEDDDDDNDGADDDNGDADDVDDDDADSEAVVDAEPTPDDADDVVEPGAFAPALAADVAGEGAAVAPAQPLHDAPMPENSQPAIPGVDHAAVQWVVKVLDECGLRAKCRFDVLQVLRRMVHHVTRAAPDDAAAVPCMYAGGKTQIGKTLFKFVQAFVLHKMGITAVIVTPTAKGVDQLLRKLQKFAADAHRGLGLSPGEASATLFRETRGRDTESLKQHMAQGRPVVCMYTKAQLTKLAPLLHQATAAPEVASGTVQAAAPKKWVLILDEADFMYVPLEGGGGNGREDVLRNFLVGRLVPHGLVRLPSFVSHVSATLLPLLIDAPDVDALGGGAPNAAAPDLVRGTDPQADIVDFSDPNTYLGTRNFSVVNDTLYLREPLVPSTSYINADLLTFYEHFVSTPRGMLLDITNPRVTASGHIFDKAVKLGMTHFPHRIAFIVTSATLMKFQFPDGRAEDAPPGMAMDHAIDYVERNCPRDTPIAIIGYSRMERGESFRSDTRVPTHVACALSQGLSVERLVQSLGRATGTSFRGRVDKVFVFTMEVDLQIARAYPTFMSKFKDHTAAGLSRSDALRRALDDEAVSAFLEQTKRAVGVKKWGLRTRLMDIDEANKRARVAPSPASPSAGAATSTQE